MILPLYNSLAPLTLNRVFAAAPAFDPDAQAYITAVELEDGQALEVGVKDAINDFVVGCKSDGIWSAIKAACILAGARTLDGALVPLVGSAPTNNNFVSGDYDRETGLVGNASTKYLNSNRNNNVDPQNDRHLATYVHTAHTAGTTCFYAGGGAFVSGSHAFGRSGATPANLFLRNVSGTFDFISGEGAATGFIGMTRTSSTGFDFRSSGSTGAYTRASETPRNDNVGIFCAIQVTPSNATDARLSFYSIGESLDLADLDSRVSTLMTDLAAAI